MYEKEMPIKTYMWFCRHFKIHPEIIHPNDAILIYHSVTRKKISSTLDIGLNYLEFLEVLTRVAIKGEKVFNKFQANMEKKKTEGDEDN